MEPAIPNGVTTLWVMDYAMVITLLIASRTTKLASTSGRIVRRPAIHATGIVRIGAKTLGTLVELHHGLANGKAAMGTKLERTVKGPVESVMISNARM